MEQHDVLDLSSVQQGEAPALANLYARHSKIVYSVALRILRSPAAAEDVMQEVFLQIWRNPDHFLRAKGDLRAWLAVVARNRAIDQIRRNRPSDCLDGVSFASSFDFAYHSEHTILCEKAALLAKELPREQREALELAFFEGMTHSEISVQTGCPLGTVKTRIRSALSVLRRGLEITATAT